MLDQPDKLLKEVTVLVGKRRAVTTIYLEFRKAFDNYGSEGILSMCKNT